jgi:malate dehydrogenase (quinone)
MIELIERCFPDHFRSESWQTKLKEMIPSLGQALGKDPALCRQIRNASNTTLAITS